MPGNPMERARRRMVAEQLVERDITSERVIEAFLAVPRHLFVPPERVDEAYEDHPVGIGEGQTISQPYMVAVMTELAEVGPEARVLEIGTGSGYQTAILARLAREVYTVERIESLSRRAEETLRGLGCENVHFLVGDGTLGWPEHAPYDAIIVTAAAPRVPESLKGQLAPGGRLILPVGTPLAQQLTIVTRREDGFAEETAGPCIFVKLIGREGFAESQGQI